jgi:tRNA threonylcarbamoyladenosine biosynthesis protein TsaE
MRIIIKDKKHLPEAVKRIIKYIQGHKILAFYGEMGAGKTTIIKALCRILGAEDIVSSPTFTMVNEYRTAKGEILYHIDFYRIKNPEEVFDIGIEEYFGSGSFCLMEWPELIEDILPDDTIKIKITVGAKELRFLDIS